MSNWASTGHFSWNNWPDNWGGGKPNDGVSYLQHTYISEIRVRGVACAWRTPGVARSRWDRCSRTEPRRVACRQVTPHNEPNDIVYPMSYDQPDGCINFYDYNASCHKYWVDTGIRGGPMQDPQPGVLGAGCAAPPP